MLSFMLYDFDHQAVSFHKYVISKYLKQNSALEHQTYI